MKTRIFILFLITLISYSSPAQDDKTRMLDLHLNEYETAVTEMYNSRGMPPWYWSRKIDSHVLTQALNAYPSVNLLFYHHDSAGLHTWYISRKGILHSLSPGLTAKRLAALESDFKLRILSKDMRSRGGVIIEEQLNDDWQLAPQILSSVLFPASIADKINEDLNSGLKGLAVVPAMNIASIPLYALQPFRDSSYLVDKLAISIVPTLAEFLKKVYQFTQYFKDSEDHDQPYESLENNITQNGEGYSFLPPHPVFIGNPDLKVCRHSFAPLSGAEEEAKYAASLLSATSLSQGAATKERVVEKARNSSLLYFATHGVGNTDDPINKSYLLFAGKNGCEKWTSKEIQQSRFSNDALVILSACETGIGRAMNAGITGLSRAFIIGGAANVVMSLWKVDDEATRRFMKIFMDDMTGQPKALFPSENLRQAILEFKNKDPRLSAWAAFSIMGLPFPANKKINMAPSIK